MAENLNERSKVSEALDQELNSERELNLLAKDNQGKNFVIAVSGDESPLDKRKFFNKEKVWTIIVGSTYALLFFLLMLGYAYLTNRNISTYQKGALPFFHLAIGTVFVALTTFAGIFPIIWLKPDRSIAMDRHGFGFHLTNLLPLFVVPFVNMFYPVTSESDIKMHMLIDALVIAFQGILLALVMLITNTASQKRYPILATKTRTFWAYYVFLYIMPILLWLMTNQLDVAGSFSEWPMFTLFLVMFLIIGAFFITMAIFVSAKHFIFQDKLISNTNQLGLTLLYFMIAGSTAGLGATFIDFKLPFGIDTDLIITVVVSALVVAGYLIFAFLNRRASAIKRATPITCSIVFNSLIWLELLFVTLISIFGPKGSFENQPSFAYLLIVAGITILFLIVINKLFDMNFFVLNAIPKMIILYILVLFQGLFGVLVSTLVDSSVIKTVYPLELSLFSVSVAILVISTILFIEIGIIVNPRDQKKGKRVAEDVKPTTTKQEMVK